MKKVVLLAMVGVALAAGSLVWAEHHGEGHGEKAGWFDMAHCEICSPMAKHPELMQEMEWETHKIDSGMLMVAQIPEKHRVMFEGMCQKMKQKGEELAKSDKSASLCGFCNSYQGLTEEGAKEQIVKTAFGNITLLTSPKPEVVREIHKHAERSQVEAKKMEEMMAKMKQAS